MSANHLADLGILRAVLVHDGREYELTLPEPGAPCLLARDLHGACHQVPVHVMGTAETEGIASHDTTEADARCYECGKRLGTLRLVKSTVFGLAEDRKFLSEARPRIYDGGVR